MLTVWKHVLTEKDEKVAMPVGAEILYAREQNEQICVWYRCDPKNTLTEPRILKVRGTGWTKDASGKYLGSAHLSSGSLVFHVFEEIPQ